MQVTTAIAIYFLIWWLTLFAVLPWGVRAQGPDSPPGTDPGLMEWFAAEQGKSDLEVMINMQKFTYGLDTTPYLARIAAPTLLLWGDDDPISPLAVGRHLQARIRGSRLHVVKGGRHDLARTHAAEVAPLIARHLA